MNQKLDVLEISNYIFAGDATFKLANIINYKYFVYKIREKENLYFVDINAAGNFKTIGSINKETLEFKLFSHPVFKSNHPGIKGIIWLLRKIKTNTFPEDKFTVLYKGFCPYCKQMIKEIGLKGKGYHPTCQEKNIKSRLKANLFKELGL